MVEPYTVVWGTNPFPLCQDLAKLGVSLRDDDQGVICYSYTTIPLSTAKDLVTPRIDSLSLSIQEIVTDAKSPKAALYAQKQMELADYRAGSPGPFPLLLASVGIDGNNLEEVVVVIEEMVRQSRDIMGYLESIRLTTKKNVRTAQSTQEVYDIYIDFLTTMDMFSPGE